MGQLEDMQMFARVVEAGGISKAAEQMNMAKSAISRRLSGLEKRLGTTLLNRTTRTSSLTAVGQNYYNRAVALMEEVTALNAATAEESCDLAGTLRLAAPLSFGLAHLTPALDEFTNTHPQLNLDVDFSDRHVDLVEEGFDMGLRIAELKDSSLVARRVCPISHVICASKDYLQKYGTPKTPKDLSDHNFLRYNMSSATSFVLLNQSGKSHTVKMSSRITANNGDFLKQMAISGHGILATPRFIVWQAIAQGDLIPVLQNYRAPVVNAYAIYPQTRFLSRRVRLLIDFLVARFGENPYWDQ